MRVPLAVSGRSRPLFATATSMTGFGLAGLSGIGVNQLLLWLLVSWFGVDYLVAAVAASVGSTTSNFLLVEHVVFRTAAPRPGALGRYASFMALTLATIPIRLPILYVLTSLLHVHYLVSNLVGLLVIFAGRYAVSDLLIWRTRPRPAGGA